MPYTEYNVYLSNEGEQITMKDKVVFFILGTLLATIAYLAGDLEMLTAEDKTLELEQLRVNNLRVTDTIIVGDTGKKIIMIKADNELAQISLHGAEFTEKRDDFNMGDKPSVSLVAESDLAVIKVVSHYTRPEAAGLLGLFSREGKYESTLIIQDLDGMNSVSAD